MITGESCGNVEAVNNGWFTMANGVVSQKGDSGGPVYVVTPDGRAAIVGMFNSTWGNYPAAVSWQTASQQAREDVVQSASADIATRLNRRIKALTYISDQLLISGGARVRRPGRPGATGASSNCSPKAN